jgi:hypothetical protein
MGQAANCDGPAFERGKGLFAVAVASTWRVPGLIVVAGGGGAGSTSRGGRPMA